MGQVIKAGTARIQAERCAGLCQAVPILIYWIRTDMYNILCLLPKTRNAQ